MAAQKSKNDKKSGGKKILLIAATVILLILIILLILKFGGCRDNGEQGTSQPETTQAATDNSTINPLTGMSFYVDNGVRPVAVMINNSKPARPQWGLCTPDIVVEGVTEAGITRMLWLYANPDLLPEKLGSLRSARHDFAEIAQGFDALFVHWGGSKYAYNEIETMDMDHLDGRTYLGKYFFRDTERTNVAVEHRGYTTGEAVKQGFSTLKSRMKLDGSYASPFKFTAQDKPRTPSGGACNDIYVKFSSYCEHNFSYDSSEHLYFNNINGTPMKDADGKQMAVTNVIILYCHTASMNDAAGCIDMDLKGGSGVLVTNGAYEDIKWEKGSSADMLKLYAADGSELELNAGKSYIGLVPVANQTATRITGAESAQ